MLAGLLLALTYALVVRFLLRRGVEPLLAYLISMTAAVLSAAHWLARPHLFTMLLVVVLLELMVRPQRKLWRYVPLFVIWANLHGGFFYGCIALVLYAVGELAEGWLVLGERRPEWFARARHHLAAAGLGLLVGLVNPNGWHLLAHVAGFFGNSAILALTQEFMSPDFHAVNGKIFLAVLLAVIGSLALSRRRPPLPTLFILLRQRAFALHLPAQHRALRASGVAAGGSGTSTRSGGRLPVLQRAKEGLPRSTRAPTRRPERPSPRCC